MPRRLPCPHSAANMTRIERASPLDLQPGLSAAAGGIRAIYGFRHHPLMARSNSTLQKRLRFIGLRRHDARHDQFSRDALGKDSRALRVGLVNQRTTVDEEAVEESWNNRQRLTHRRDVELAAKAAHRDLKGVRGVIGAKSDGFPVQYDLTDRKGSN